MSPAGLQSPPVVDNTDTLYLGDQHCQQTVLDFLDEAHQSQMFQNSLYLLNYSTRSYKIGFKGRARKGS